MTSDQSITTSPAPVLDESSVLGRNKRILLAALRHGGVSAATVTYAGSGDSGSVDAVMIEAPLGVEFDCTAEITVFAEQGIYQGSTWHTAVVEQQVSIEQALQDFAEAAVELLHGGWENGDGASGNVVFECQGDTVRIEHTTYFIDSDHMETTL